MLIVFETVDVIWFYALALLLDEMKDFIRLKSTTAPLPLHMGRPAMLHCTVGHTATLALVR